MAWAYLSVALAVAVMAAWWVAAPRSSRRADRLDEAFVRARAQRMTANGIIREIR